MAAKWPTARWCWRPHACVPSPRDVDVAARLGAGRLALLLEGPITRTDLANAATQVVARGLRPSELLPPDITLRLTVACALLPEPDAPDGDDPEAWLERASAALDELAPPQQRSIRHLNF